MSTDLHPSSPAPAPSVGPAVGRAYLLFALGAALLVGLGLAGVLGFRELGQAQQLHTHTFLVLDQLSEVREAMLDVETGARGFALSGTPEYLEPYEAGRRALGPALARVRALTADNPGQQGRLTELESLTQARLTVAEQLVQLRRAEGLDAVQKLLVQGAGKRSMDAVRQALDGLEQEERRLLGVREAASRRAEGRVLVVSTTARVTALLLFGAAFLALRREQRRRAAAEADLQQFNTDLEARVTQRTSDLTQANQSLAAAQARLRLIIETEPECVKVVSPRGELLEMNAAGLMMLDAASLAELNVKPLLHFIAPEHQKAFVTLHGEVMAGRGGTLEFETIGLRGTRRWLETHAVPLRDAEGKVSALLGVTRDITPRKQAEAIVACQTKVLELIAGGTPLAETLTVMLQSMEAFAPGMLCSVLLLDADGQRVRHGAAPSLPEAFNRAVDGQSIGASAGSCGTAAFRRAAVIVEDILTDPLWVNYRELALAHGLRACWSTPIFDAQQRVLGTFAIYYREPGRPTEQHLRCIGVATYLAAVAIGKQRADAALRVSESRHRRLVESNIIGVMIANTDGRITESNDLFLRTVGYTRADLEAGRLRWDAMTPPEWRAVDEHILRELQAAGTCQPVEKEYLRKDGTRVPILASVAMIEGTPGACICLIADMAARKQAEQERQKFVLLAESSTEFIGMCDLDLQPLYVNPAGLRMVGLPDLDAACRIKVQDCFFPEDQPFIMDEFFPRVLREGHGEVEIRLRHFQTGAAIWMSYYLFQVRDARGAVVGWATVSRDITERKHAEAELVQLSGRLLRAQDEERRRLARELHDSTAQTLAALAMNLAVLGRKPARLDAAEQALLAECEGQVKRGTTELRTFAYLLHPPELEALGLVRSIHDYAGGFAKRSGVVVTLDVPEPATRLPADLELTLFRVVQECLGNIHRHARSATANIQLVTTTAAVTLEVRDAGGGLTLAQFSGLRSGSLEQGVGFAGMRERLRLLGGRLELEPGAPGLCVRAVLPLKRAEPAQLG